MRALLSGTNVDPSSGDYPKGRVRDLNGGAGTIVNEVLLGDLIQFFQKLIIDAGIVENGNPDNVSNGYQILEALVTKIRATSATTSLSGTSELATESESLTGTDTSRIMTVANNAAVGRHRVKTMSGSETYSVPTGVGRIFIPHNTNNATVRLPGVSTYAGAVIYVAALGVTSGSNIEYPSTSTIQNISSNRMYMCISNGSKWYVMELNINNADGLACPFVYVNGAYFDEILKNILDFDGEEILDLSGVLIKGENEIKLSEEKEETTYLKGLYFNGKLLDSNAVLKKGQSRNYKISYDGGAAQLKAVGHYKYD